jgi:hypothetical protein
LPSVMLGGFLAEGCYMSVSSTTRSMIDRVSPNYQG